MIWLAALTGRRPEPRPASYCPTWPDTMETLPGPFWVLGRYAHGRVNLAEFRDGIACAHRTAEGASRALEPHRHDLAVGVFATPCVPTYFRLVD